MTRAEAIAHASQRHHGRDQQRGRTVNRERVRAMSDGELEVTIRSLQIGASITLADRQDLCEIGMWHHRYATDLNACAEFEKALTVEQALRYNRIIDLLWKAKAREHPCDYCCRCHVSARLRCEAYVLAMTERELDCQTTKC